jgi:hypothetical protein
VQSAFAKFVSVFHADGVLPVTHETGAASPFRYFRASFRHSREVLAFAGMTGKAKLRPAASFYQGFVFPPARE